jgi:hypothetical protein
MNEIEAHRSGFSPPRVTRVGHQGRRGRPWSGRGAQDQRMMVTERREWSRRGTDRMRDFVQRRGKGSAAGRVEDRSSRALRKGRRGGPELRTRGRFGRGVRVEHQLGRTRNDGRRGQRRRLQRQRTAGAVRPMTGGGRRGVLRIARLRGTHPRRQNLDVVAAGRVRKGRHEQAGRRREDRSRGPRPCLVSKESCQGSFRESRPAVAGTINHP